MTNNASRTIRVLIADDSQIVRTRLVRMLSEIHGIETVGVARNATEARTLYRERNPDVVILDLRMPDGSGLGVLEDIKRDNPRCTVIMLTLDDLPEFRNCCLQAGANFFFSKAGEFGRVAEVLTELVRRSQHDETGGIHDEQ